MADSFTYPILPGSIKLENMDWDYFGSTGGPDALPDLHQEVSQATSHAQEASPVSSLGLTPSPTSNEYMPWQTSAFAWPSFLETLTTTQDALPLTAEPPVPASIHPTSVIVPSKTSNSMDLGFSSMMGASMPPTPPTGSPSTLYDMSLLHSTGAMLPGLPTPPQDIAAMRLHPHPHPHHHHPHPPSPPMPRPQQKNLKQRRHSCAVPSSSASSSNRHRSPRRRSSSHPSVASVVSLTAHAPVHKLIDGVEHMSFLYSHDRMVKEYTVCINVDGIALDAIPTAFRDANTIYPRANVPREVYDGNRWDYESSCNTLGWKLCWLNKDQLCGRRGLIQRAVDAYRNHHADMRSRRVTRQEKVANGTLRKRKSKRYSIA
ncbi:hypothetical protein BC940DRAFT_323416 [Gongronella butleri]|nr:hypothetical protein BC940DRAFT_323416 [Gongronella butleri]